MERAWCWYEISPCPFWYTMNPAGILITQYLAECKHSQNAVLHGSESVSYTHLTLPTKLEV